MAAATASSAGASDEQVTKLARTLKLKDLVYYGLIFMIPLAPIAYYGDQVGGTAGMVALAYAIGAVAMLFTGFSYASMSKRYPFAGSVYNYVQKALQKPGVGFIAGWSMVLDYLLLPAVVTLVGCTYASMLFPAVPTPVWVVVFLGIMTVVNILGVQLLSKLSRVFFYLQMLCICWMIVAVLYELAVGNAHLTVLPFYNAHDFNPQVILSATGLVVLSFLGFDAISTLAEEVNEPRRTVGKGVVASIALIGVIFVVEAFFIETIPGADPASGKGDAVALMNNLTLGGPALSLLTQVVLILSFPLASGEECMTSVSRILYSMGRDGVLPKKLAYLSPRYHTPVVAVGIVAAISLVLVAAFDLGSLSTLVSFGALFGFMLLNLSVIYRLFVKGERTAASFATHVVSPLIGFGVCLYLFLVGLNVAAWTVGGIWLVVGFGILVAKTHGFQKPVPMIDLSEA